MNFMGESHTPFPAWTSLYLSLSPKTHLKKGRAAPFLCLKGTLFLFPFPQKEVEEEGDRREGDLTFCFQTFSSLTSWASGSL